MAEFLFGAVAFGSALAGLVFLRFWRQTRDLFFLLFAVSFWIEALGRTAQAVFPELSEENPAFYVGRVIAYGLILAAIWLKNRPRR